MISLLNTTVPRSDPISSDKSEVEHTSEIIPVSYAYEVVRDGSIYNVLDPSGDVESSANTADVAINWAMSALGGEQGTVYLPTGTYEISNNIQVANNAKLLGDGPNSTVITSAFPNMIKLQDVSNAAVIGMQLTSNVAIGAWAYAGETRANLLFENITAQDTSSSFSASFITINCANSVLDGITYINCEALYPNTYGFIDDGVGNTQNTLTENILFDNCKAIGCGVNGRDPADWAVGFDLCEGTNVKNMLVENCVASENYQNGFHFESMDSELNCKLVDCVSDDNGQANGAPGGTGYGYGYMIWKHRAQTITLSGCTASGNYHGDTNQGVMASVG